MAIRDKNGINVSFDSTDLIYELEQDVLEFGNIKMIAIYELYDGAKIYTDYNFIEEKENERETYDIVEAEYLLKYFKKQNELI